MTQVLYNRNTSCTILDKDNGCGNG